MDMFKGLLFLQGHSTFPDTQDAAPRAAYGARTAASAFGKALGNRAASAAWFGRDIDRPVPDASAPSSPQRHTNPQTSSPRTQGRGFLDHLLLLGGRPMHAGWNVDIQEPFELAASDVAIATPDRRRADRRIAPVLAQPRTCAG